MKHPRIAILNGVRTPVGRAGGMLKEFSAVELGVHALKESLARTHLKPNEIDEVIIGNVAQPIDAVNIARVIALTAGIPQHTPAFTVHRNCASGMQAITSAAERIFSGGASICLAGGVESMSHIPLIYNQEMTNFFAKLSNRKQPLSRKIRTLLSFRPRFLKPIIGVVSGLTDPTCGLNMGQTAEVLAKEFNIGREEQDRFALRSHARALAAQAKGRFADEIHPILSAKGDLFEKDEGPRDGQTLEKLGKLNPYFDRHTGTVTVGNACSINDGAATVILMTEQEAKRRRLKPLGYLTAYTYAALEANRMGLGPIYATHKLLKQTKKTLKSFDLIEINEAFAAQVIANLKAFASTTFSQKYLEDTKAMGELDQSKLNVNGGAIALGHPVGMTGARLVIHLLHELHRRKKRQGLATLCVGGGQGAALALEAA